MNVGSVGVIGAGTMGAGIAQVAVTGGCAVRLLDADGQIVRRAVRGIHQRLERLVEKGRLAREAQEAAVANLQPAAGYGELGECDLIIEAVVEDPEIKLDVFAKLERYCGPDCILATNTSSLSVSKLGEGLGDPSRLVGMHFFNPAPVMPLVEIIAGRRSRASAVDVAFETATAWGKTAVRAKDSPGFIVNRVARPFYLEALRILGEGLGDVATIDRVMREAGGFPMGPFQLMDLVGLDVNYAVSHSVYEQFGQPARLTPHKIQARLVADGDLGRKSGRGFYDYAGDQTVVTYRAESPAGPLPPPCEPAVRRFAEKAGAGGALNELYVLARILTGIFNEAYLALEQDVASAADIDLAMQKGTHYPRGPITWAQAIGHDVIKTALSATRGAIRYDDRDLAGVFR